MTKLASTLLLTATAAVALTAGGTVEAGATSHQAVGSTETMARELTEAIEQAQPVPDEYRHLLEHLLALDDGGSAGTVAASVNSTELPELVTSRDGSGSTAASRYETAVCFWRSWGKVCYYL